ncbi:MAG: AEC family transporter [Desulfobacterales bacterium]|nr:AEC family transporter [Desulfobacterales bacterium]
MSDILHTIIPIFAIISLGMLVRVSGIIKPAFMVPANRLVYYLALPAMIFRALSKASFKAQFNLDVLVICLVAILFVYGLTWLIGRLSRLNPRQIGPFVQSAMHGNLGYIGLAVAFYYLGQEGFVKAGIIAGSMMILQNFLSVVILQIYASRLSLLHQPSTLILKIIGNPVILAALAGIVFSSANIPVPLIIDRSLGILGGLALPMALLIIGASLSFEKMWSQLGLVGLSAGFKLFVLPLLGLVAFKMLGLTPSDYLPGLILLATPTATVAYVLAKEMGSNSDFIVATISITTLASAVTFAVWLTLAI